MENSDLVSILENSKTLSEVARQLFGGDDYSKREKTKSLLLENNIDWVEWKNSKKQNEGICPNCGKVFLKKDKRKKFCCSSCAASFNNKGRKHTIETREKISHTMQSRSSDFSGIYKELKYAESGGLCKYCGKQLNDSRSLFCDNSCYSKFNREEYIKRWKEGKESGLSGKYEIKQCIREYLLENRNYTCEICGCNMVNPYTHKTILQIHHKDGDCTNNKPNNLMVLCPNCHAMTENFGSRNKNATRKDNRKRY